MARKPGELVPIGEVFGGLNGPVKMIREATPPAWRGFTQADQVNQLVSAGEADPDLGFMARMIAGLRSGSSPGQVRVLAGPRPARNVTAANRLQEALEAAGIEQHGIEQRRTPTPLSGTPQGWAAAGPRALPRPEGQAVQGAALERCGAGTGRPPG